MSKPGQPYCPFNRKNRFVVNGETVTWFNPETCDVPFVTAVQFVVARLVFCWRANPVKAVDQEMTALLVADLAMDKAG